MTARKRAVRNIPCVLMVIVLLNVPRCMGAIVRVLVDIVWTPLRRLQQVVSQIIMVALQLRVAMAHVLQTTTTVVRVVPNAQVIKHANLAITLGSASNPNS